MGGYNSQSQQHEADSSHAVCGPFHGFVHSFPFLEEGVRKPCPLYGAGDSVFQNRVLCIQSPQSEGSLSTGCFSELCLSACI